MASHDSPSHTHSHEHTERNFREFFNKSAASYEKGSGNTTRNVATEIVQVYLTDLPKNPRILDNACGPAILTEELLKAYPNASVDAVDLAPGMIDVVKGMIQANGWEDQVRTDVMNGCDLKLPDNVFDASVTNFGIFMMEPSEKAGSEIYRTLKEGGLAVITTWKKVGWPAILDEIAKSLRPGKEPFRMPKLEKWFLRDTLEDTMKQAGLKDVQLTEFPTGIWKMKGEEEQFTGKMASMIGMLLGDQWTPEEKEKLQPGFDEIIANKDQRDRLFIEKDGILGVEMIAWIGVGRK